MTSLLSQARMAPIFELLFDVFDGLLPSKSQGMLNWTTERESEGFTCDLREEKCKCMLYSLENSTHFAAGSMAEVQVRLLPCLSFVRCRVTDLKSLKFLKITIKR